MSELRMEKADLQISGSGVAAGGIYKDISLRGSAKISGDTECEILSIGGTAKVDGILNARHTKVSGSATFLEDVNCDDFTVSGSSKVLGYYKSNNTKVSGSLSLDRSAVFGKLEVNGNVLIKEDAKIEVCEISGRLQVEESLQAEMIKLRGVLKVHRECNCDSFFGHGVVNIDGQLNVNDMHIEVEGLSKVKSIKAKKIIIEENSTFGVVKKFVNKLMGYKNYLEVNEIEAENIYLENTSSKIVRGKNVTIGKGCEIGRIEYTGQLEMNDQASVSEYLKI